MKELLMKLYKELNILEDKKLYNKINLCSIAILIITTVAVLVAHTIIIGEVRLFFSLSTLVWVLGVTLVSLPIHEFIHGIFFKAFSTSGKVKYGFTKGMLYATNPGQVYTKRQFMIIILAPFVINSILFCLLFIFGMESTAFWIVFILHTAGCAGDFWYIYEIIKNPNITHCEDTPVGAKFFVA